MEDCPDGRMDKDKMQIMFKSIIPEGEAGEQFLEQLFRIFDKDGDGSIDFKEFMIATDMTSAGDPEEKLRWAFRMYDKDGSGGNQRGAGGLYIMMLSLQERLMWRRWLTYSVSCILSR